MMTHRKHTILIVCVFLIMACVYFLTLRGIPGNLYPNTVKTTTWPPFESSLERGRYAVIVSLVTHKTFTVDPFKDFIKPDLAWYNNHYFSPFPPGVSVLALPLFLLGTYFHLNQVFTFSLSSFFILGTAIILYLLGRKIGLSMVASLISVCTFAFASDAWAYGVTLSAHPISAFLTASVFFSALSIEKGKKNIVSYIFLWVCYGLNIYIDYPNLFILAPLILYGYIRGIQIADDKKNYQITLPYILLWSIIPLLFILLPFFSYNLHYYHKPVAFTNTYNLTALQNRGVHFSYSKLSNNLFNKKSYATRFTFDQLPNGIYTLLFSSDRGLFFFFPIFLLAIGGFVIGYYKRKTYIFFIAFSFIADLLVYGTFQDPYGGWAFGPRYLITTLPLMSILVGAFYDFFQKNLWIKILICILFIASCFVSLTGTLTTNAVPPSIEHIPHMQTNFLLNIMYLQENKYSSFFYGTYLHSIFNIEQYGTILFLLVCILFLYLIWVFDE